MENPASQAHPALCPEVLALLEDHPRGLRPSRARQAVLMEEALAELEAFTPLLELRLGQVLAPLVRGGHKHLGYVTPAVFCREELGISATAAWDSVRLAEGLLRRPVLRQAFLEGRLPRTHVLELLRLDAEGDAAWVARAAELSVQELRRALKPLRSSAPSEEKERARVRIYEMEAEPYAMWLAAVELARRREGRDLGLVNVLEQILAEFAAGRPLQAGIEGSLTADSSLQAHGQQRDTVGSFLVRPPGGGGGAATPDGLLVSRPKVGPEATAEPADPPPFQRNPRWPGTATDGSGATPDEGGGKAGTHGATFGARGAGIGPDGAEAGPRGVDPGIGDPTGGSSGATPQAEGAQARPGNAEPEASDAEVGTGEATPKADGADLPPAPELPCLLLQELPRSPRKLTRLARRLLASRERLELQRGRILRRVQEGRLYREAGQRSFRAWLEGRGIAASTAFQATARDQRMEKHGLLREALSDGRLSPTKVDLLLRLPRRADAENWVAYAESRTCRRLEEAVEAALVLASRFPVTWSHRRGSAPREEETLDDFRRQAGMQAFEATFEDLAQAFQRADSGRNAPEGVQTSAAPPPASVPALAPDSSPGGETPTEAVAGGARALAAASQTHDGTLANAEIPGTRSESTHQPGLQTPEAIQPPPTICLRLVLPESLDCLLQAAEARLRGDAGEALTPEECLYVLCLVFLRQAGSENSGQSRVRRQALERAGYRCEVPGCVCRTNLHVHHIQRRSQGGSDELENLAVACAAHHLRHLHGGTMRVEGADPATRIWEIGLEEGEPWRVWCDERLVDGEALDWEEGDVTPLTAESPEAERVEADGRLVDGEALDWEEGDVAPLTAESPEAERVEADGRLVDGEALAWEEGDDRVCEVVREYRAGPFRLPPEGQAA